ncbi:efflux RND transporter periplasmic adaptor subunit [Alphaproteobacteria bacterium]|nr:efflux RND transporter periplasmic adaptor subunit [Alphaproteobacteria bacterium]
MAIRGILIALIIFTAVALGMVINIMSGSEPVENNPPAELLTEEEVLDVRTRVFKEDTLVRVIQLAGQTQANRRETIVAQSGGTLAEVRVDKGDVVKAGDVIAVITAAARDDGLRQAEAALEAAQVDLEATQKLVNEGFAARNSLVAVQSAFEAAVAGVEQAREQLSDLEVRSTLGGIVENRIAQIGGYVGSGDPVIAVTSLDPMVVSADAGERRVAEFELGQTARVELATGQQVDATVSYISPFADPSTRTFEIEAEAPNPDYRLFEGVSASLFVNKPTPGLHYVPTGLLQRAPDGRQGLFSVTEDNKVNFNAVTIVSADSAGSWVDGLDGDVVLITVGQASVNAGQSVNPVDAAEVEQMTANEAAGN